MRTAAIGIGSNSLRMLIADINERQLHRLKRYREGLRVFAALDEAGNIQPDMIQKACESVRAFQLEALRQNAEVIHLFATSAVRDAANQQIFSEALKGATGLELDICSGDTEASLSFWGAAEDRPCGLIDIGGGSTEIVLGHGRDISKATSLQMGAVRLQRMMPIQSISDAHRVVELAGKILLPVAAEMTGPSEWIGVGGTFTTTAAFVQRRPWQEREGIHGYVLTPKSVEEAMGFLAPLPIKERLKLDFLQPQRADIVVHGMAILLACMQNLQISAIKVSEFGNLEGYLKAKYIFSAIN